MLSLIHAECYIFYFHVESCHVEYQYAEYRFAVTHDTSYTSEQDKNSGDFKSGTVFSFAQKTTWHN